jgi:beta-1,4-N-acetylglucosaminyltransferase
MSHYEVYRIGRESAKPVSAQISTDSACRLSLFITVGSTLFPSLTSLVLSPSFLDTAAAHGISNLVVQYGRADIELPDGLSLMPLEGRVGGRDEKGEGEWLWSSQAGKGEGVRVRMMRYTGDFTGEVSRSDVVISHAGEYSLSKNTSTSSSLTFPGSGSILTALRAAKPLLVVANTSLMDNHQAQLAEALREKGYLMVSTVGYVQQPCLYFVASTLQRSVRGFETDETEQGAGGCATKAPQRGVEE